MAYRADIEIGVKGAAKLKELQDRLTKLSRAVEDANVKTIVDNKAVQSLNEYSRALAKAKKTLNETAIQLDKNGNAIGNYRENIRAYVTVLGQANDAQKITNDLITKETDARTKATAALKAYNAAAAPARRVGSMTGAYLRPGEARLKGQTSPGSEIAKNQRQIQAANNANIKSLERQLQIEQKIADVRSRRIARERSAFLLGSSGTQRQGPLAGPGSMGFPVALPGLSSAESKGLQIAKQKLAIINRTIQRRQALNGLAKNLQNLEIRSKVAIADANREKQKQVELEEKILQLRRQASKIRDDRTKAAGSGKSRGGGFFGSKRFTDIATGAGFPLLFGGGPLQALAGGLGGAAAGLGGSIIASAAVAQFEQFVQGIAEAGQALDAFSGDVGKIAEMTGTAGNESIKYAKALEDLGFKQSALQIATQQAAQVIGTQGVGALQLFAEDTKRLSDATARVGLKIQAFFAQALGGFTNLIAQIVERLGGAKPADTGSAPAKALAINQVTKFNRQELDILRQEFEIKKLIGEEDAKQKQVAEAKLAISNLDLEISKKRREAAMAVMQDDIAGELQAKNAAFLLEKKRLILELELSQAEAAKRVYDQYTAQADALQGIVHQSKMRLNQEKAVLEGRNKLTGAYYSAELKLNSLAIQRAKQKGDTNQVLQLELRQVELIYKQTLAQIQAEVQRAQLKARQVALATQELQIANLRKQAEDKIVDEDRQALQLQRQALAIANSNVRVAQQVAEQQIRGAQATRAASIEGLKFASSQERAAAAAGRTANAMNRVANASARASSGGGTTTRGSFFQDPRRTKSVLSASERSYVNSMIAKGILPQYQSKTTRFAEGGYVTRPTNALIAERGENEYVIPESKMNSAIKRYTRGARGESVVEGSSETSAAGRKRSGAVVNISTGPVMRMDDQDYVTISDLNEAVGNVASAMSSGSEVYGGSTRLS